MTSFKYNAVKIRRVIAMCLLITMLLLFAPVTAEASSSYSMVTIAVDGVTEYPLAYVTLTFTAREDGIYITEIEIPYFQ